MAPPFLSIATRNCSTRPTFGRLSFELTHRGTLRHKSSSLRRKPGLPRSAHNQNRGGNTPLLIATPRQKATLAAPTTSFQAQAASQSDQARRTFFETLSHVLQKPRTVPVPRWITPKHYTVTIAELFGHSSFLLVACSYAVDDFLWLRMIAVAGSSCMLVFTWWHPHGRVLWLPFKWNLAFIAINSYRIAKVFLNRYYAEQLSPELLELRREQFYTMDSIDFARLIWTGTVKHYKTGDLIIAQGENNRHVGLVVQGRLDVLRDGKLNYILEPGNFVQEAGLHAGLLLPGQIESCCAIVATKPTQIMTWDRTELVELMERFPALRRSMKAVLSWDIVRKLKAQRLLVDHVEDSAEWTARRSRQTFHRYSAILSNLLSHPEYLREERQTLTKYRQIHGIDDEYHNMALRNCGWTPEEFEAGRRLKRDSDDHDDHDTTVARHDMRWWLSTAIYRVFD